MRFLILITSVLSLVLSSCIIIPVPHTTQRSTIITGRTIDARTHLPIAAAQVKLGNFPKTAATTDDGGCFTLDPTHNFHLIWYENPSFVMHFPQAGERYYWSGELNFTQEGYKPLSLKASEQHWPGPNQPKCVTVGDVLLQRQ